MGTNSGQFIKALTESHKVIVIGGLAIIAHGFNRPTKEVDVRLDPMDSPESWAAVLEACCRRFEGLTVHTLPGWRRVSGGEIAIAAEEVGMVRVLGLDCPLDIFRRPNDFPTGAFDDVLSRCTPIADGTWLPHAIDLAISKDLTNRDKDARDIMFFESKVRKQWIELLPAASPDEARELFDRFVDWKTCEAALANPNPTVMDMALSFLKEFALEGDPFSASILEDYDPSR